MDIHSVGVVGAGTMGAGIAQVCAQAGYQVLLSEINQTLLDKGLASIKSSLNKSVEKGLATPSETRAALDLIQGTTELKDFQKCDLVIEAVPEDFELKKKLLISLDSFCPQATVLATNTSCLSVTDLAMATRRCEKVLGLHFFNPVPVMSLIEMVHTILTSEETLRSCEEFGKSLNKTVVKTIDQPGFIVNRLAMPFILNAVRLLENGVATREDIDASIKLGLNHPLGPLALADLIGLDVVYYIANSLYTEFRDPQYVAPILLKKLVTTGSFGRKSGKGFYDYNQPPRQKPPGSIVSPQAPTRK